MDLKSLFNNAFAKREVTLDNGQVVTVRELTAAEVKHITAHATKGTGDDIGLLTYVVSHTLIDPADGTALVPPGDEGTLELVLGIAMMQRLVTVAFELSGLKPGAVDTAKKA